MSTTNNINDLFYMASDGIFIVIHRLTGRWCSLDMNDVVDYKIQNEYGALSSISGFIGSPLHERILEAITSESDASRAGSDKRSFEYLLLKCTSACNYSCTYCYDHDEIHKSKNLDFEKTCERVKEALDLSKQYLTLLFHGGEPLIRKKFIQDVSKFAREYAKSIGKSIFFKMQTHGGMFSDDIIDFLTEYDFFVGISLDGPPAINDQFRVLKDGTGTYSRFHAAYQKYGQFMRDRCGVITTPTTVSSLHLLDVARYFREDRKSVV